MTLHLSDKYKFTSLIYIPTDIADWVDDFEHSLISIRKICGNV